MTYKDFLKQGFDAFRKWFNKNFSLSYCGKFCGLRRLGDKLNLFVHKLEKVLSRSKCQAPLGDVISMSINGCKIKLYFR